MKKVVAALAVPAAFLAFSACGSDDSGVNADNPSSADYPVCEDVWVVGETLDLSTYDGCTIEGDSVMAAITQGCYSADGEYLGQFSAYDDSLYVLQTGTDPKTGSGGTAGVVTDTNPCGDEPATEEPRTEEPATDEATEEPATDDAPAEIAVDCPDGLEDGTYTRQPNGKYFFQDETEYPFTLAEIEEMNAQYGCKVL